MKLYKSDQRQRNSISYFLHNNCSLISNYIIHVLIYIFIRIYTLCILFKIQYVTLHRYLYVHLEWKSRIQYVFEFLRNNVIHIGFTLHSNLFYTIIIFSIGYLCHWSINHKSISISKIIGEYIFYFRINKRSRKQFLYIL